MEDQNLGNKIEKLCNEALKVTKDEGVTLDYSNDSIVEVEKFLDRLYQEAKSEDPKEEQYSYMANVFGAYIGTTLIKNLGLGSWEIEPVNNALSVKIRGEHVFFPAKVYRRLKNGREDNVAVLYQKTHNKYGKTPISLKVF